MHTTEAGNMFTVIFYRITYSVHVTEAVSALFLKGFLRFCIKVFIVTSIEGERFKGHWLVVIWASYWV